MKELKDINFNGDIILKDNRVKGAILPKVVAELERDITIQSDTIVEGAVYARKLEMLQGEIEIREPFIPNWNFMSAPPPPGK